MRRFVPLLLSLSLVGCTSPAALKINEGLRFNAKGDLATAELLTKQALTLQPTHDERAVAINNLGAYADARGDREYAIRAFTLAARMGLPLAQQNLLERGEPIPAMDLLPQPAAAPSSGALDAALLMFLATQQGGTCTHQKVGTYGVTKC